MINKNLLEKKLIKPLYLGLNYKNMNSIEEKCKEKGVELTDQEKVIAKVLSGQKSTDQKIIQMLMNYTKEFLH